MVINKMPLISVVMPVYNGEKYLQQSIDSILNQTYKDFELIMINDGSQDKSAEIMSMNAARDTRIVILENQKNSGICVTLNKGFDAAKGKYIARMDCDDIAMPDRLAKQFTYMESHPDIDASGTWLMRFGENIQPSIFDFDDDSNMCYADMFFFTCMAHPTVILRRSFIEKYQLRYDEHFKGVEDFYLWWRIAQLTKVGNIKEPLLRYRIHNEQVTKNFDESHKALQQEFLDIRLRDLGIELTDKENKPVINYIIGDHSSFTDDDILDFIEALSKVVKHIKNTKKEIYRPLRFVCGKAITQVINRSSCRKKSKRYYINTAYSSECMSTIWYLKLTFHPVKSWIMSIYN